MSEINFTIEVVDKCSPELEKAALYLKWQLILVDIECEISNRECKL